MKEDKLGDLEKMRSLVPDNRYYTTHKDGQLDTMLKYTAEIAEEAGREHLAAFLWYELGFHHEENGVPVDHELSRAPSSLDSIAKRV